MYTDLTRIQNYLLIEIEDFYEEQPVEQWIEAMSRNMDKLANRRLVVNEDEPSGETKYYDGNNSTRLEIDDAQSIISVEVGDEYGENLEATTDFISYPKNAPHTALISKGTSFPRGAQNIAVTGTFGLFNSVPEDIAFACTVLVAGIIINQTHPKQSIASEKIGNYAVSYRNEKEQSDYNRAMEIINNYRKYEI